MNTARSGEDLTWRAASVCRKYPTTWWFAGGSQETALAKDICSGCPVAQSCLEFALSRPDLQGIWAATTPTERVALRRTQRASGLDDHDLAASERAFAATAAQRDVPAALAADVDLGIAERDARRRIRRAARRGPGPAGVGPAGPEPEISQLLTPAEAARQLGVTPNTVTRWSRAGKISAIQTIGGHRRFRRSEVERVLREANLSPSPSD